jgi:hypothetical protein
VTLINQDQFGARLALCASTPESAVKRGARTIAATAVWVSQASEFRRLNAGIGACDPAWSPDGKRLALTAANGLWIFPAGPTGGRLVVESKVPIGEPTEFTYRAFAHPKWSPGGALVALLVTNGATSWVEVFDSIGGRLFYTSPPESYSFSWGATARDLRAGDLDVRLPPYPPSGR